MTLFLLACSVGLVWWLIVTEPEPPSHYYHGIEKEHD
jgi:hypothetical protein